MAQPAAETGQLPVSLQLADLSERLAACEAQLGHAPAAANKSCRDGKDQPLLQRITLLTRRVDEIFKRDKKLQDFERNAEALDDWLKAEHASVSHVLLHRGAKRNYVVQHAEQLQDFARSLQEVEANQQYINPPSLRDMPLYADRLRRVEASSTLAVGSATELHDQVARLAEEYHNSITAINHQLLHWDRLLTEKNSKS
eukprot:TRINITY_DN68698_c0_g1_i1.p1 TRINITY_DN68698_c0_g1~~TRINITY_DN68698_c0_g1_i1.p1  ORF type:complete len:199 (+),score=51.20 TRINITY_DN68698_c0_g1_i1:39-635(+)